MNIMKNMELVLLVVPALACSARMVLGADPQGTRTSASAACATHSEVGPCARKADDATEKIESFNEETRVANGLVRAASRM